MQLSSHPALEIFAGILEGHDSEFSFLSTNDQNTAKIHQSVIAEALSDWGLAEERFDRDTLTDCYWAVWKDASEWRVKWAERPVRTRLIAGDDYSGPELLALPSSTSSNWLVLLVAHDRSRLSRDGRVRHRYSQFFFIGAPRPGTREEIENWLDDIRDAVRWFTFVLPDLSGRGERPEHRRLNGQVGDGLDF